MRMIKLWGSSIDLLKSSLHHIMFMIIKIVVAFMGVDRVIQHEYTAKR